MYLKSLTLKGFKSFAQPTSFAFEPGVTCIVGPNGSGKSNVVDALAWVMGEQGAKTLRGGKMEDVIFAGTSTRGPLGRAEVSLTIDNSDGALPIEYSEVTISRTLFRNGTSEYAINGEQCRLLDVQELLSDSGLGREMHVIVGQGQLDQVLRATPEDRRGFIEEAAGILKHRRRKEKTLRKLDAMQANLTRLSDLAGEIRRQLKPLGRQAEVAREAATIAAVVRDARARLLADEVVGLRRALDEHGRSEHERHAERLGLQDQLERHQAKVTRLEAAQSGDDVDRARSTSFALEQAQGNLRSLDSLARQRIALLESASGATDASPSVTREMIDSAMAELDGIREGVGAAASALDDAHEATMRRRVELDTVDEGIARQSALVSAYDLELSKLAGQADTAASKLAAVRGEVLRHENALEASAERRSRAVTVLAEAESAADTRETAETDLDEAYELAQAAVFEAEAEIERIRDELHGREREHGALGARTQALSLALDQKDGSAALVAAGVDGVRGLLAEAMQVQPGYEAAIAAALGSLADAVLVDDRDAAYRALDRAESGELGRVALALADAGSTAVAEPLPEIDGLTAASAVVSAPAGVQGLLAEVLIADDLAAARAAERALGASPRPRHGDHEGRHRRRAVRAAWRLRAEAESHRAHRRARSRRSSPRGGARRDRAQPLRAHRAASDRRAVEGPVEARARGASRVRRAARPAHRAAQPGARPGRGRRGRLRALAAGRGQRRGAGRRRRARRRSGEGSARARAGDAATGARHGGREGALAALETAREAEVEAKLRLETAKERVRAEEARIRAMQAQFDAERQAAADAARRAVIRRAQLEAASRVAEVLPQALASVDASVAEARVALGRAEAERASRNEELQAVRRDEAAVRERLHAVTEDVHGLELRIYEKKLHVGGLVERAESELGLTEDVLVAEYGPDQQIPAEEEDGEPRPFQRDEQQRRLAAAERKLAQLGRVNPLALEEFAALEQRHQFLSEQLTDLANTRKDLLTIIEEIDTKMESIFRSAFDDTQAAFAEVFPVLFPGGAGSISLTNPDDMLTTGIEVSVKPAGKKIERLSLLSGGERSLAAVALLMAIFKARPSPFYIMDEVEAALDDANLGRLLSTFEDLRDSSQLIVITHQKRTMEIADALYGVSMRQDGVSAVVGQRVREEREARAS